MDYNLAKQLKDAGFPQKETGLYITDTGNEYRGRINCETCEGVYVPTLSELIEACGDGFYNLTAHSAGRYLGYIDNDWKYEISNGHQWVCNWEGNNVNSLEDKWESEGKTPEEAVALLWLELNKK